MLREKGTEQPFTGQYYKNQADGMYHCAGCNAPLFSSEKKFDSGSGWPSFAEPAAEGSVEFHKDSSLMMERTEVTCGNCGAHLGHVFQDGPAPGGQRFCINSISLDFEEQATGDSADKKSNPRPWKEKRSQ